jgi:hypothetical protein
MFKEISNYTVEAEPHGHYVDFTIYNEIGLIESHEEAVKLGIDPQNRDHLPRPAMLCSIKWDGCSNLHVDGDNYQLHFCGLKPITDFGNMLKGLYSWAAELLPEHKDEILYDKY